jgi:acyl-CoA reductase-like NAD-dependent aldehyde dehydrogenase
MNLDRYQKLAPELRKVIDDTTGLALSLKGAAEYDGQSRAGIEAAGKNREVIRLSAQERQRWLDAFKPLIRRRVEEGEKAGLPARGLIDAYGLLS